MRCSLCEGGELFEWLVRQKSVTEVVVRRIFRQIVEGVKYCHGHRVAHRDLKPENILFVGGEGLDLKIVDFGVAFEWEKSMRGELLLRSKNNFVGTVQ